MRGMKKEKVTLSNEELAAKCSEWISKLCKSGGKDWTLRIPVDFNNDPDVLFSELIDRFNADNWIKVSERLPEIEENNSRIYLPMHVITTDGKMTIADYTRSKFDKCGDEIVSISFEPIWICREQGCEMTNQQIQVELYQPLPNAPKD